MFVQIESVMFVSRETLFETAKQKYPLVVTDTKSFKHNIENGNLLVKTKLDYFRTTLDIKGKAFNVRRSLARFLKSGDLFGEIGDKTRTRTSIESYAEDTSDKENQPEDSLDVSMNETDNDASFMSVDQGEDPIELTEVEQLKLKVKSLEDRLSVYDSFFGKQSRSELGPRKTFGDSMKTVALRNLAKGAQATTINNILVDVAALFGHEKDSVPSVPTLARWRSSDLKVASEQQLEAFVKESDRLEISLDDTSVDAFKVSGIGLFRQNNEYMLFDMVQSNEGTGAGLFEQIKQRLQQNPCFELIMKRVQNLVTDMGSSQVLCNKKLCKWIDEYRNAHWPNHHPVFKPVFTKYCCMHTLSNVDSNVMSELSENAATMHSSLKMLFGRRGVNKSASKTNKEIILTLLMGVASRFKTDCGVRYRTGANNGKWIILDELEV